MARPASKYPTELELEILKALWRQAPATVRQVREALTPARELAYTSVMTVMTIMAKKGYLKRVRQGGGYVYTPAVGEREMAGRMLGDVLDRVFDGSAASLLVNLLETNEIDAAELDRIRGLIGRKTQEGA